MTTQAAATNGDASGHVAGEIRAELARQRMSIRQFATKLGVNQLWLNRRVSTLQTEMSLADIELMANGLGVPTWRLLPKSWLPRLDSNQQPLGKLTGLPGVVSLGNDHADAHRPAIRPALYLVKS